MTTTKSTKIAGYAITFEHTAAAELYVEPCPGMDDAAEYFHLCDRCGGRGQMEEYRGIDNGYCYECLGSKGHMTTVAEERRLEKGRAKREATRINDQEKKLAVWHARLASYGELYPVLAGWTYEAMNDNPFLLSLWEKSVKYELTTKQLEAAVKAFENMAKREAEAAAEEAAKVEAPTGKQTITGAVVHTKWQDGYQSWQPMTPKALVELDGWKAWVTIPAAVVDGIEGEDGRGRLSDLRGKTVTFTATFEHSRDDKSFAIAKRPSKFTVHAEA